MFDRLTLKLFTPMLIAGVAFIVVTLLFGADWGRSGAVTVLLLSLLTQILVSYWFSQQFLVKRLERFKHYLDQVISVDCAPEQVIKDSSGDQLGVIINELGEFIDNLSDVIAEIKQESDALHEGSEFLSSQMRESVSSVDESVRQIELMASAIEQVASTSLVLSENAAQVCETTGQVMSLLEQGKGASSTSQSTIETFADEINAMASDLMALQEECVRIGTVLDVIRGIAEQTNLLALNAAIEAARAGEQGRGFAVVADEVRALAHRTQVSTVEIQSMVEGLQGKSRNAVSAIERGQQLTQQSLTQSNEVVDAFEQIGSAFASVDSLTGQIAQGTEEQQVSTRTMNDNMSAVVELSRDINQGLNSVAQHAENQQITTAEVDATLKRICV